MNLFARMVKYRLPLSARLRIERCRRRLLDELADADDLTFVRLRGNLGDHLIWAGARQLLRDLPYQEVAAEHLGDARGHTAVMSGCGGWCEPFHGLAPQTLLELERRFERVVVLPSTFDPTFPMVREVLESSKAKIYARDRVSYELIAPLCDADLAYDCAFYFDYSPYRYRRAQGVLLAYRVDAESAIDWESLGGKPRQNRDISRSADDLDHWLWQIASHETVRTDRAHVAIAGGLMGRTVEYSSTTYHKVPAIAEYSLGAFDVREREMPRIPST